MSVVKIFIGKDKKSEALLNDLKKVISQSYKSIKLIVYRINSTTSNFQEKLLLTREVYNDYPLRPLLEYNIKKIPAIIVDEEKKFEGYFPSIRELSRAILGRELVTIYEEKKGEEEGILLPERVPPKPVEELIKACEKCFYYVKEINYCIKYGKKVDEAIKECELK